MCKYIFIYIYIYIYCIYIYTYTQTTICTCKHTHARIYTPLPNGIVRTQPGSMLWFRGGIDPTTMSLDVGKLSWSPLDMGMEGDRNESPTNWLNIVLGWFVWSYMVFMSMICLSQRNLLWTPSTQFCAGEGRWDSSQGILSDLYVSKMVHMDLMGRWE